MIRNWYNQIPYPALKIKREITKYINWQQFTKGTHGKPNEQLFLRKEEFIQLPKYVIHIIGEPKYKRSAQSKNRYKSRIVLRKVGILTLLRNVGILTLRNTILELLLRKVRIGTKWEYHFIFFFYLVYKVWIWRKLEYTIRHRMEFISSHFCIKHMIIENSPIKYVFDWIMVPSRFLINVKQRNTEYHLF